MHPTQSYQYGFVFDADGVTTNNYVPDPQFPNDFFRDTDRWYELTYTPQDGRRLTVTNARDNLFETEASSARAVITGDTIFLVVSADEFEDPAPAFRVTAFCHGGDFGLNPPHDWSGDTEPKVGEPLAVFGARE